jgi:hypothetical protein
MRITNVVYAILFASSIACAASGVGLHISFRGLQQLDTLSSGKIESQNDAAAYVRKAAVICGTTDPSLVPGDIESRLVSAEWEASKDPNKLVSDDQVARAFNFMSDEFGVQHPARLTASDILQFRSVQASIFPHVFSPKTVSGSRPVGAIAMLYQLWFNGGVTEGVRRAAQLDRPPGSLKTSQSGGWSVIDKNPNLIGREYQVAGYAYFAQRSPRQISSFLDQVAGIIGLPQGR